MCVARARCALCVSSYLFKLRCRLFSHTRIPSAGACGYPRSCSNFALLVFTYSDSSRAKCGDPVNKKALRAYRPQTYCPGLPQSYANVSNVSVALRNDRGGRRHSIKMEWRSQLNCCAYPRSYSNGACACSHILGFPRLVPVGILVAVQTSRCSFSHTRIRHWVTPFH